ncbi:type I restriction endonuclease subunit R [Enterobacter roggenkampii]|uniref:Type I restriction enzyme endonuclease subunit n=1 Tax=Enterobacter roggenkampii TaxID=1812935 RepID=A0ABD7GUR9_9ENTR|nr:MULTISPECIES: type I restriction endonuclease subunit R [Enterobacteriaceae]RDT13927.1 type I restriction endonuclease subunit R [Enterobacter roggenkampii]RDT19593.1 type I restriction endonuclease subunit R [Enterobacter roggenkampii]RDT37378.1 type I restriction endonuclease subunit R [Enterobacter roggenkampii]RDT58156.1 type I restriction endonuclease subunit R [Enterobacter roggenkampii]GCB41419.1 DEAD/DEAH box helicase [Citrobacter freundii]
MAFNESNTVEAYIRDLLVSSFKVKEENGAQESIANYFPSLTGIAWIYMAPADIPRQNQEILVEAWLRDALIRLNPEIAAQPDLANEVLYRLRAIVLSVRSDGLIRANEEMTAWMRGERSMPFGQNNEHVPVRLIDLEDLSQNQYVVTQQFTYRAGATERRADLVLLVNGLPLVLIEAKTPVKKCISWVDGAIQVHDDYEEFVPELFVCNVFSVATEGKLFRYGSVGLPVKDWGPWHLDGEDNDGQHYPLKSLKASVESMLRPQVLLDILSNFTLFATDKKKKRIKVICRYQQFEAANKIVERVLAGYPKKGLIWHFQGSGKSLLMVFAAQKLRMHVGLKNPTVLIVVDRIDLDSQISGTFAGADIPNLVKADSREKLQQLLSQDVRKIIITTIFKFGEANGCLNERSNIIVLVDEAHRTQEGNLGRKMRESLPNAFLFGLTGTPINRSDRNTFYAFGAEEDDKGYMSRYGFDESIRDGATLKLHFEPRLIDLHIDKAELDAAYKDLTGGLSDLDKDNLAKTSAKMAVLVKTPERIRKVCADIVQHYQSKIEPNGLKGQIVTFDRESCLLFKAELDKLLPSEATDIVMSVQASDKKEHPEYAPYDRTRDEEERLLDRFRDPADPLKLIIVTAKLLTGFDAPILQVMYLDKPLRDHTLLQAICRVNRTYSEQKTHGLIVDYLGIFDDVAAALEFDDQSVKQLVSNIQELKEKLPEAMQKCLAFFVGCDRTLKGYEGLIAAQQCLPNNEVRDNFASEYSVLSRIWEALSPDVVLAVFEKDYKWLSQVYQSVQPSSGHGKLIWHSLGAKTIELIHQNVHVDAVRDDLDTLVLDADLLEAVLSNPEPKKAKEIEIKLKRRLRGHGNNPKFKHLSERLDALKDRFESGQINSIEFLKQLLEIAKETLQTEKTTPPEEELDHGKAALTELFNEVKTEDTPIIVERVVADIDEIVRLVRFPGWQSTLAGEREVKKALRKALFKYKLHADDELFEKAYSYIRQYY